MLYIIPTPIGNLKDITLRAIEVLKEVDGIICEDTRRTSILLNHYQIFPSHSHKGGNPIKIPMIALNDFNEARMVPEIIQKLKAGENLALVSDAGTPLISDPGYKLVRECIHQGIPVDSLPGPSSVLTALTLSDLPPDKFFFLGYPPEKPTHRLKLFQNIHDRKHFDYMKVTYIMFISPHKLSRTLADMQKVFGDIEIVLAHELTKIHQSVKGQKISQWLEEFRKQKPKGEYVLLFNLIP